MVRGTLNDLEANCPNCGKTYWISGAHQMPAHRRIACFDCFTEIGTVAELLRMIGNSAQTEPREAHAIANHSREQA